MAAPAIKVWLDGSTFERDGIWVAKSAKFGVFAYADSEEEATARVFEAIEHLIAGTASEDELIDRLTRAEIQWERVDNDRREWRSEATIRKDGSDSKRAVLALA